MASHYSDVGTTTQAEIQAAKKVWRKIGYVLGLGCCMNERISRSDRTTASSTQSRMEEIRTRETNWSTSTLGLETDLNLRPEAVRSDDDVPEIPIPLSSFEFYTPLATPVSPPSAVHRDSTSRSWRETRKDTRSPPTLSPVTTITDHDIATGTTPSTSECQRDRSERKEQKREQKRKEKAERKQKNADEEKISSIQAWSQVDPLYGMYAQEPQNRSQRSTGSSRFSNIRAFDFMSYGGWIII